MQHKGDVDSLAPARSAQFVSRKHAAKILGCSVRHLEDVQRRGVGPATYDIGGALRYDLEELIAWARSRRRAA